jgi:hypothetical protein
MVESAMTKLNMDTSQIDRLHSGSVQRAKNKATGEDQRPKVILSTSIAETYINNPKVDHVLDAGISRAVADEHEMFSTTDRLSSEAVNTQREARVGHSQIGCSTRFVAKDMKAAGSVLPISLEALEVVVALSHDHCRIQADSLRFCQISMQRIESVRQQMDRLKLNTRDRLEAITETPFRMRDAAVFLKGYKEYGVGYEVAALLLFQSNCSWPGLAKFKMEEIIGVMSRGEPSSIPGIDMARKRFDKLCEDYRLEPSKLSNGVEIAERVAAAVLLTPERLVWKGEGDHCPASYIGEPLVGFREKGYFVAMLLRKNPQGLHCALSIPCTEDAMRKAGIKKFDDV